MYMLAAKGVFFVERFFDVRLFNLCVQPNLVNASVLPKQRRRKNNSKSAWSLGWIYTD